VLRIRNFEGAGGRGWRGSVGTGGAHHTIALHSRWCQLAPVPAAVASTTLSCQGRLMSPRDAILRCCQQKREHERVSRRGGTTHAVQHTADPRAPRRTCAISNACVLRTHGERRAVVDEQRCGRLARSVQRVAAERATTAATALTQHIICAYSYAQGQEIGVW
jgi:hypothetical protein